MSEPARLIDLRSDTVTRPSPEMRRAMAEAAVGDDVLGDDPTVIALQDFAAELFGKEAALYMPSGTMTNQAALHAQTTAGDEIFLHAKAHIVENEQGGAAVLSGLQTRTFDSDDGTLDLDLLEHYFHVDDDVHHPRTTLVAVENTHNYCGGVVYPLDEIRELRAFCDRHGMILHLAGDERKLQTNMVFAGTHGVGLPAAEVVRLLDAEGVLALDEAPWSVRFVTHLDLDDAAVEEAGEIVARVVERVRA